MAVDSTEIVVLGGGFAGAYCVRKLERLLKNRPVKITLVNQRNNFVFTPLLVEAATSALEPRHVVVPLRGFLKRAEFVMAEIKTVDVAAQSVTVQPEFGNSLDLRYDHLVLAMGSETRLPNIPGLTEFAFGLKTLTDAMALRDRAIGMLEMANLSSDHTDRRSWLTFAIVGAGYTGVEAAGEFNAFLKEAAGKYPHIGESDIRVMLIQRADRILEMLDQSMSDNASKVLTRNGVEIRLNESLSRVDETSFTLASGEVIPAHTVIWSAGVAPSPLLKDIGLTLTARGYLDCDTDLRVQGKSNIWGIGDCASNPDAEGKPYPPTAQHALREGEQAAVNLAAVLAGKATKPLNYRSKGTMAPLGGRQAIANVFGFHLTGWLAWFLWRTVYLGIMPGWGRRVRVAMDWTVDLLFRRDYSQRGSHRWDDRV